MDILGSYGIKYYGTIQDKRVVLLQSGGLDSCVLASLFSFYGYEIHHVFVNYGFNSVTRDLLNVKNIVEKYGGTLHIVDINIPWLKDVTNLVEGNVKDTGAEGSLNTIEYGTYVPMRNAWLLSIASSLCDSLKIPYLAAAFDGLEDIITHEPLGGTTDKHPFFVQKMENALNEGSSLYHAYGKNIRLLVPLMGLYKDEIISIGLTLGTDFSISNSCYNSGEKPCGHCSACELRKQAFDCIGIKDPLLS